VDPGRCVGVQDKRLKIYMGGHKSPEGEQRGDILAPLPRRLRLRG